MIAINQQVPRLSFEVYHQGGFKKIDVSDLNGKWLVLYFYPADFSFLCPTELKEAAGRYDELKKMNTELISISTDTVKSHQEWHNSEPAIKTITFPMAADSSGKLAKLFGVYMEKEGTAQRSTFIINPEGYLKSIEIHDNCIGRSISEIIRKLTAFQYVAKHPRPCQ